LLQTDIPIDRDARAPRDLLAPQTGCAAALAGRQTEVARIQALAPATQELAELLAVAPSHEALRFGS